jgi:N-acetylglucosaminyldiphosphoundecaprenol N-acetyl-beta-D-mannosaminyltransferase
MGIGRQEQFLLHAASSGWTGWGFTCGGYLDQLAGGIDYYPRWVDQANLRFLYRLYREPRRLWRRYCLEYGEFAVRVSAALAARPLLMVAEGTWPWTNEAETARRQA